MSAGWSLDPAFIAAFVGALCIVLLAVVISTQLFSSAGRVKDHLKRASDLAADKPAAGGSGNLHPRSTAPRPADDEASQQIFGQLTQYYAANINESFVIFWASLLSMVAGFVIIIVGIASAGSNTGTAIVAGIAGLLSQFIAATFLVALRSTQQQSTAYAQSLADLRARDLRAAADAQAIDLGLQLLAQISADGADALANQTRAALAMGLIVKQIPAAESPAPPAPAPAPPPEPPAADDAAGRAAALARARIASVTFDAAPAAERITER